MRAPFVYVGGLNGDAPYTYATPNELPYLLQGRYGKNLNFYTHANKRIYLFGKQKKTINVTGIFENPAAVEEVVNCDNQPCWTIDEDYPITGSMIQQITTLLLQGEYQLLVPPSLTHEVETEGEEAP